MLRSENEIINKTNARGKFEETRLITVGGSSVCSSG